MTPNGIPYQRVILTLSCLVIVCGYLIVSSARVRAQQLDRDLTDQLVHDLISDPNQAVFDNVINYQRLEKLNKASLRILRNTVFAQYGYRFTSQTLQSYYEEKDWYTPRGKSFRMTPIDSANVRLVGLFENTQQPEVRKLLGDYYELRQWHQLTELSVNPDIQYFSTGLYPASEWDGGAPMKSYFGDHYFRWKCEWVFGPLLLKSQVIMASESGFRNAWLYVFRDGVIRTAQASESFASDGKQQITEIYAVNPVDRPTYQQSSPTSEIQGDVELQPEPDEEQISAKIAEESVTETIDTAGHRVDSIVAASGDATVADTMPKKEAKIKPAKEKKTWWKRFGFTEGLIAFIIVIIIILLVIDNRRKQTNQSRT